MTKYRNQLPQLNEQLFLTDGGIETTLVFHEGLELPYFAAFDLLKDDAGREALRKYFRTHAAIARKHGVGFVLESATWRANSDWGSKIGYSANALAQANGDAIAMLHELRREFENGSPFVISGCIGPRGDGYKADQRMSAGEAEKYHAFQADIFREAGADLVSAITMTYAEEAIGITHAARAADMPVVISFTTETGRSPAQRPVAGRRDSAGGRGHEFCARLLHDQLRAPDPFREYPGRRAVGQTTSRPPRQRFHQEPRGT